MSKINTYSMQQIFTVGVLAVSIFFGLMTSSAQAQTADVYDEQSREQQLLALVAKLQERLLVLQRKQYENTHQEETNIIHGNSYVEATERISLYKNPGKGRAIGRESRGDGGEVSGGPRLIDGEVWWKIDFAEGGEGWVKEEKLERIPSVVIRQDQDGDGVQEAKFRIIGDYDAKRIILFPSDDKVVPLYIPEDKGMIGTWGDVYVSGQSDSSISGDPLVQQTNSYAKTGSFIKGRSKSVPIAWGAENIPEGAVVEVAVEAVRLVDSPLSGGVWSGETLAGRSVSVYFWNIEGVGRIGAGEYRTQVSIRECGHQRCEVIAKSPYHYFSIENAEK